MCGCSSHPRLGILISKRVIPPGRLPAVETCWLELRQETNCVDAASDYVIQSGESGDSVRSKADYLSTPTFVQLAHGDRGVGSL